uniref:Uncharacterized protein n=1 Tax=Panagrolaimus sp. JU765 TaxID=591449 RepID=A0AC34RCU2_9BILA
MKSLKFIIVAVLVGAILILCCIAAGIVVKARKSKKKQPKIGVASKAPLAPYPPPAPVVGFDNASAPPYPA